MLRPLLLLSLCACAAGAVPAQASPWGKQPYGLVIVGEGGGADADWDKFVAELRKAFGKRYPMETFSGPVATRDLQQSLDRLKAAKVQKIIVVPVFLSSQDPALEQLQYLLGLRQFPSEAFLSSWKMKAQIVPRVKVPAPLVLTWALDDDPVIAEILYSRAKEMSREPRKESVVIVGEGLAKDADNAVLQRRLDGLSQKVAKQGGFSAVRAVLLRPDAEKAPMQAERTEHALTKTIRGLSYTSRVIVVPYLLTRDGRARAWRKDLDNLFFRWNEKGLLPDARLGRWVDAQVGSFRDTADMVRFKDAGQALPPPERKRNVK